MGRHRIYSDPESELSFAGGDFPFSDQEFSFSNNELSFSDQDIQTFVRHLTGAEAQINALKNGQGDELMDSTGQRSFLLHQTQLALLKSEARFQNLVHRIAAVIFELDPDGRVIFVNDAITTATGYTPEELLDENWWEIFFPGEAFRQIDELYQLWQMGEVENYRLEMKSKDGAPCVLELSSANHHRPDGSLERIVGFGIDVSAQARAQVELTGRLEELAALKDTLALQNLDWLDIQQKANKDRQRYQDLFEFAPDGYLVTNAGGIILEANRAATGLLKVPLGFLEGQPLAIFVADKERPSFYTLLQRLGRGENVHGWEMCLKRSGEGAIPVSLTVALVQGATVDGESNRPAALRWLLRDISDRRQAEEALRQSELRFRTVFEQAGIGIDLVALDGSIIATNPALREMLGFSGEEFSRMTYLDFTHPDDREKNRSLFEALVSGQRDHFRLEKRYLHKNERVVWAVATVSLVRSERGQPSFAISMVENISEQKQMAAELAEVQRRLLESVESERLLLAQELHDGPVQELYGLTYQMEDLRDGLKSEAGQHKLNAIQAQIRRIVQGLRTTSGELRPPTLAPFGLEKAISSHAAKFHMEHPEYQLHLNLTPDGQTLPPQVRLALYRIYQHALSNILRHAEAKNITIRLLIDADQIVLEIQDDGRGFTVPERWIKLAREGHLGLVSADERARAVGGSLIVESALNQGTLVRVKLSNPVRADAS